MRGYAKWSYPKAPLLHTMRSYVKCSYVNNMFCAKWEDMLSRVIPKYIFWAKCEEIFNNESTSKGT